MPLLLDLLDGGDDSEEYSDSSSEDSLSSLANLVSKKKVKPPDNVSVFDFFRGNTGEDSSIKDPNGIVHSFGVSEDSNKSKKGMEVFIIIDNWFQDSNVVSCPLTKNIALFCVFDGHSGSQCAKKLAKIFPDIVKKYLEENYSDDFKGPGEKFWEDIYDITDDELKEYEYQG